ncbi:YdcF family protein [Phenylobacterium sp.]|uniref:YdcF family protein n=1 Tax=Phenylobacterium sp. TaxID=1871053 RepID=UPI0035AE6212
MESPAAIVIFGAAVRADGRPSPSLARRIGYGLQAALRDPSSVVLCSGAVGRHPPSEAAVMAAALRAGGVPDTRIVLDEESRDTLQSVLATVRFLRARGLSCCIVCSDRYHILRIRLLLGALGVRTKVGPLLPGRGGAPRRHWLRMRLREALAIPYDLAIVLTRRRSLLSEIRR